MTDEARQRKESTTDNLLCRMLHLSGAMLDTECKHINVGDAAEMAWLVYYLDEALRKGDTLPEAWSR
jgi:hypothetical protein